MSANASPDIIMANGTAPAPADERVAALEQRVAELEHHLEAVRAELPEPRATLVLFSDSLDKALAAMVIATGAAALGLEVSVFVTFWGLNVLKQGHPVGPKSLMETMIGLMNPGSSQELQPSKMAFWGIGSKLLRQEMARKSVASLEEMIALARELGVTFTACEMSMEVMGIKPAELMDGVAVGGVAAFLGDATRSKLTLFV